jgi:hypothetical protein
MLRGRVVPLIGPSVRSSLPDTSELASRLADEFGISPNSCDLAEVAQCISMTRGEEELYDAIGEILATETKPMPVHDFLAEFPRLLRRRGLPPRPQLIISTNYDWALERAFEAMNEPFDYAVYMARSGRFVHFPWGEQDGEPTAVTIDRPSEYCGFPINDDLDLERTVIIKSHGAADGQEGTLRWRNDYLVTEDQYINYLPSRIIQDHLPIQILEKLTRSRCLFLGYTLRDWNARVLLRRIWQDQLLSERSWAIAYEPDDLEKGTWSTVGKVELLCAHSTDYVNALREALADWQPEARSTRVTVS